jgi:hypothetical protein
MAKTRAQQYLEDAAKLSEQDAETQQAILCSKNRMAGITGRLDVLAADAPKVTGKERAALETEVEELLTDAAKQVAFLEQMGEKIPKAWGKFKG